MAARLIVAAMSVSIALLAEAQAQRIDDRAVFGVLQRADPTLFEMRVIHRVEVTEALDLAIAIGTPRRWELGPPQDFSFVRTGDHLVAATDNGITVTPAGAPARHHIVDQTTDGRWRVAPLVR